MAQARRKARDRATQARGYHKGCKGMKDKGTVAGKSIIFGCKGMTGYSMHDGGQEHPHKLHDDE